MKLLKILAIPIFIATVFFSCKKTDSNSDFSVAESAVAIKKGVVTFNNTASYLNVTANKNDEQQKLAEKLRADNFLALANKQPDLTASSVATTVSSISTINTAFNPDLYSTYLLSILNQDKICSINGYWVKVDMDNIFCSAIDATAYPSEYDDLKNNVFTNTHIMTFLNPNEPVIDVLDQIRNNTLTWQGYQTQLANAKGGQGICFKNGAQKRKDVVTKPIFNSTATITASAEYGTYFLHFELVGAIGYTNLTFTPPMYGKYHWEGVCKGFDSNTFNYPNNNIFPRPVIVTARAFYSGGSALRIPELEVNTSVNGVVAKASIYY